MLPLSAIVTALVGLSLLILGITQRRSLGRFTLRIGRGRILQQRLMKKPAALPQEPGDPEEQTQKPRRRNLAPLMTQILTRTSLQPLMQRLEATLTLAHIPLKPAEFLYITISALMLALLLVQVTTSNIITTLVITLVAGLTPFQYLQIRQRIRFAKIDMQVADSLLLITNSLRAGTSFMDALDTVSREMPPPISEEFARAVRDVSLGVPVDEAFVKMSTRCRSEDLDLAVTAFKIQREVGGNLAEILENIAATIRERLKLRQEIHTLSAQGKLSGGILCGLPIFLGLMLRGMNPDYLTPLLETPQGHSLIAVAAVMQILGVLAISRIIRIEV